MKDSVFEFIIGWIIGILIVLTMALLLHHPKPKQPPQLAIRGYYKGVLTMVCLTNPCTWSIKGYDGEPGMTLDRFEIVDAKKVLDNPDAEFDKVKVVTTKTTDE